MEMIQKELIGDLKLKWDHMQQAMQKINAGGCLLTVDVNLYYTTGRIYSGYFYLPAEGAPWFFVKRPNGLTSLFFFKGDNKFLHNCKILMLIN